MRYDLEREGVPFFLFLRLSLFEHSLHASERLVICVCKSIKFKAKINLHKCIYLSTCISVFVFVNIIELVW